ncbi:MAG: ABC transporter permease subunit [Candidatus Heimdallarchaeota archaeon]|nr:ABC transporter permease subunit [Candidatus Heimdallarchaeota archaeon]
MVKTEIQKRRFENHTTFIIALFIVLILVFVNVHVLSQSDDTSEVYWIYSDNQPSDTFTDVIMLNADDTLITGMTGNIYRSSNFSNSFNPVFSASSSLNTIEGNNSFLMVAGESGYVAKSTDGNSWEQVNLGQTYNNSFADIEIQGNHIWIIGDFGIILYSNDSGSSFKEQSSPKLEQLNSMDFINSSHGWIVGGNGLILKTTNYGNSWITLNSETTVNLNSIYTETSQSDRIWIGGDNGMFLASLGSSFGDEFTKIESGTTNNINDVYSPIFGIVWAVGDNSTILAFRGNEFKDLQVLSDNATRINFHGVFALGSDAVSVGDKIYFNIKGLIPAFETDVVYDLRFFVFEVEPLLLVGMVAALKVIMLSLIIGFIIGLLMATLRTIRNRPLNMFATAYSDLFRNTPLLVQLFFISFGLPELGVNPPLFIDAVLALSLNTGAYQSEIIRSGILAIPKGQMEAARSLGMTNIQSMKEVILPQAVRLTIPPLSNEAVILFLNSSLLSVIAYEEITRVGTIVANSTLLFSTTFIFVALTYFIVTYSITQILRRAEKKLKIPGLGGGAI